MIYKKTPNIEKLSKNTQNLVILVYVTELDPDSTLSLLSISMSFYMPGLCFMWKNAQ